MVELVVKFVVGFVVQFCGYNKRQVRFINTFIIYFGRRLGTGIIYTRRALLLLLCRAQLQCRLLDIM